MAITVKTWRLRMSDEWAACLRNIDAPIDSPFGVGATEDDARADLVVQVRKVHEVLGKWLEGE
jgi:hypothetical protein